MKKTIIIISFIASIFVNISCDDNKEVDNEYVKLAPVSYFELPEKEIVDSIAEQLSLNSFSYLENTHTTEENVGLAGIDWISKGKKYINSNNQSIIIWLDKYDNIVLLTYLDYRHSQSNSWAPIENEVMERLNELIQNFDFVQKNNEMINLQKCAIGTKDIKYYEASCFQTFNKDTLNHPCFKAELEGDTSKINFIKIPVWYKNLDAVSQIINDNELKNKAKDYFQNNNNVVLIPEQLEIKGYWIIYNKLCKKVGSAKIDEYGSYLNVFIDIQNGEIIEDEQINVRG